MPSFALLWSSLSGFMHSCLRYEKKRERGGEQEREREREEGREREAVRA